MDKTPLVNINTVSKDIVLDIRYATSNNFTHHIIYESAACYVHQDIVKPLQRVVAELAQHNLKLKIFDAYRPVSAQFIFWEIIPDERFIANPYTTGSNHSRGVAIDATLVDAAGNELAMPTPFDTFDETAYSTFRDLPAPVLANRTFFHTLMQNHDFIPLPTEWWHFDFGNRNNYPIITTIEALQKQEI